MKGCCAVQMLRTVGTTVHVCRMGAAWPSVVGSGMSAAVSALGLLCTAQCWWQGLLHPAIAQYLVGMSAMPTNV